MSLGRDGGTSAQGRQSEPCERHPGSSGGSEQGEAISAVMPARRPQSTRQQRHVDKQISALA